MIHGVSEGQALGEGRIIGERYRLEQQLGAGGMGEVWIAVHTEVGRRVALKMMHPEKAGRDAPRFRREAMALGKVDSQHVTAILDAGTDAASGARFLVMELLHGEDVEKLLARVGPLAPQLVLRMAVHALAGLGAAHAQGILHRDIKPANLFLTKRGDGERLLKVVDFGIAKLLGDAGKALTATGAMLGSAPFMSPEQLRGAKDIDGRSDLWSLGVTMYEALAGRPPFDVADGAGIVWRICFEEPVPLRQAAPWVPSEIAAVVARAMAREPDERFRSAQEMANAIKPLLHGAPGITDDLVVSLPEGVASVVRSVPTNEEPILAASSSASVLVSRSGAGAGGDSVPAPAAAGRSRTIAAIGALLFVVVAVFVVFGLTRAPQHSAEPAGAVSSGSSSAGPPAGMTTINGTTSNVAGAVGSAPPPTSAAVTATNSAKAPAHGPQRTPPPPKSTSDAFGSGNK
jgi:serine/threonine-protein kinase